MSWPAGWPDSSPASTTSARVISRLRRLRAGDHRAALATTAALADLVADAPATVVLTAIHWRNTWKYRARAFRHFFWDAGTLLANLLATAVACDVSSRVLLAFADPPVNALLGIDAARESSLALVPLGRGAGPAPPSPPAPPLGLATAPLSPREVDYPLVRAADEASALTDVRSARAWLDHGNARSSAPGAAIAAGPGARARPPGPVGEPSRSLGETILRRGSTREFRRDPITGLSSRRSSTRPCARSRSISARPMLSSRPTSWSTPSRG